MHFLTPLLLTGFLHLSSSFAAALNKRSGHIKICRDPDMRTCADFDASGHCFNLRNTDWDNKISSFDIEKGTKCSLYYGYDCKGTAITADGAIYNLSPFGKDNMISSIECVDNLG